MCTNAPPLRRHLGRYRRLDRTRGASVILYLPPVAAIPFFTVIPTEVLVDMQPCILATAEIVSAIVGRSTGSKAVSQGIRHLRSNVVKTQICVVILCFFACNMFSCLLCAWRFQYLCSSVPAHRSADTQQQSRPLTAALPFINRACCCCTPRRRTLAPSPTHTS